MLKYLRDVKRTGIVLLLIACCIASSFAYGTTPDDDLLSRKITIKIENKNIKFALDFLVSKYSLPIIYGNTKELENSMVKVNLNGRPLKEVLISLLSGHSLSFQIIDHKIVIIRLVKSDPRQENHAAKGTVTTEAGELLAGATIKIPGGKSIVTDEKGRFQLPELPANTIIQVSFIGYKTKQVIVDEDDDELTISLEFGESKLNEVSIISNGYQDLPKERATGSFATVDNQLLNRRVSTNVVSRLEGVVPGLLFNRNTSNSANGQSDISIRGTNTLYANNQPLIVLDNFPYDGDINNINPNDIENITVLKDAAAASIWGVQSGNGVIVITTKKGKLNQKLSAEFNANVTVGNKPDLYYGGNVLKSHDFINLEQTLFNKGYYDGDLSTGYTPVTPVVQLLADERAGTISSSDANKQINALRNIDVRNQELKYFYQKSVSQQYALNLKGGNTNSDYILSLGDDNDLSYYKGNKNNRITINSFYDFYPIKNLKLSAGLNYIQSSNQTNNPIYNNGGLSINGHRLYPYAQLVDPNGNALSIPKDYASSYTNNIGSPYLDWNYRPLDELHNADNTSSATDNRVNLAAQYSFLRNFNVSLQYQYERSHNEATNYFSQDTYYTRNLINEFTQLNDEGSIANPIPVGGILQQSDATLNSHHGRLQMNYNNSWKSNHELTAIAGAEITDVVNEANSNTAYGYNKDTQTSIGSIDYLDYFTVSPTGNGYQVPTSLGFSKTTDHYLSYFTNAAYTYLGKYTISASGRIDKSNLFGVSTNQKAVPLYSAGAGWNLSKENFYRLNWLPYAKLRATYGYTGNINKSATAVTTISQSNDNYYSSNLYAVIANPGNPELRWEKVRMINLGLDFALKNNIISGSFEYYTKKGIDLFGNSPLPPSTGLTTFFGNTADTKGHGLDIVINSRNINTANFRWTSNFLYSHVIDIITRYDVTLKSSSYISSSSASSITPLPGKALYGLYSYKWAGLTHSTGDPQGYLNGQVSTDYSSILSKTSISDMDYNGSSRPTSFGSLRNNFSYKALSLSVNLVYKLGYYFRRTSYTSSGLPYSGTTDFYKRWQNPGDELNTNIPSLQYPPYNNNRDIFYQNSAVLIDRGDHVRLQDITLSYDLEKEKIKGLPFRHLQIYGYLNNVAILWRANKDHLDPDLSTNTAGIFPIPRTIAFGFKAKF